ncbi:MAG: peptidyl-tRNA hydrolase Pth2 [Candidatus Woesearchaeota archaeon]
MKRIVRKFSRMKDNVKDRIAGREYKQVILMREDLKLPKGKMAVQAAHASVSALMDAQRRGDDDIIHTWKEQGMKKVVLRAGSLNELKEYEKQARIRKLPAAAITDAGRTVVEPGTTTCLGIGPAEEKKIDEISGNLKSY